MNRHTSFQEILDSKSITVYHSCSFNGDFISRIKSRKDKNVHAGSLFQAVWRADFKVNDEEVYPISYIYELELNPVKIYNKLILDSGGNVVQQDEDQYKAEYDLLVYHNTGEGHAYEPNLSVIVLNHDIIKSAKLHSIMDSEQITKYMKENN